MQDRQIRYPYRQRLQVKSSEPTLLCLREVSAFPFELGHGVVGGVRFFFFFFTRHGIRYSFIQSINKDLKSDINLP